MYPILVTYNLILFVINFPSAVLLNMVQMFKDDLLRMFSGNCAYAIINAHPWQRAALQILSKKLYYLRYGICKL
jgi:hypothetical protein